MLILSLIFKLFVTLHFSKRMTGWKNNKNDFIVPLMIYQLNELKCNWKANWQRKFCVGVCFHFKRLLFLVFIRGGKEHDYIKSIEYYCSINTMTINNLNYLDIRFVCIILVFRRLMKCHLNGYCLYLLQSHVAGQYSLRINWSSDMQSSWVTNSQKSQFSYIFGFTQSSEEHRKTHRYDKEKYLNNLIIL